MSGVGASASEGSIADAARDALARGNAVDAVVTAVLVAAVDSPSVLLGPVQMLVGGPGAGLVGVDGRVRQPGRGAPRPRGFLAGETIPGSATMAAPAMPGALAAALGALGSSTLHRAAMAAVSWAKAHRPERARVAEALARLGPAALAEGTIAEELLAAGGRASRGLLTSKDLGLARPDVYRLDSTHVAPTGVVRPPWRTKEGGTAEHQDTQVVVAGDSRGILAVACWERSTLGTEIASLGLVAPPYAEPVMRGRARVRPGDSRPAPAPIAMHAIPGSVDFVLGIAGRDADAELDARLADLGERRLGEWFSSLPVTGAVGLLRQGDSRLVARG